MLHFQAAAENGLPFMAWQFAERLQWLVKRCRHCFVNFHRRDVPLDAVYRSFVEIDDASVRLMQDARNFVNHEDFTRMVSVNVHSHKDDERMRDGRGVVGVRSDVHALRKDDFLREWQLNGSWATLCFMTRGDCRRTSTS